MRKVLIITYYWPPSGGSAVLRWLKFTKYLREFGWEPVIYTPVNPEPQETDASLLNDIPDHLEIVKKRIIEPYGLYKFFSGKKQDDRLGVALMSEKKKPGLFGKLSLWIRSNLFIPDPRVFWIRPSLHFLRRYLEINPVDIVVTTGPPHSMHLIGLGLKRKPGLRWVADFRDPWTNIDFFQDLPLTIPARWCHHKLEKRVLREADHIVTVSPGMTQDFKAIGVENISTITNGYDEESLIPDQHNDDKFSILHLGSMPRSRNPLGLWQVLSVLVRDHAKFASYLEIRLVGKTDFTVMETITQNGLQNYVVQQEYVPHKQTYSLLSQASVLLLCINNTPNAKGILTNKFFEYLSAQRPIVAIGPPDGDVSAILNGTGAGRIFGFDDTSGLKNHLVTLFELYLQGRLAAGRGDITRYSRKSLTREVSALLNKLVT